MADPLSSSAASTAAVDGGGSSSMIIIPSAVPGVKPREIFRIELKPGETTIVSWKKLLRDSKKVKRHGFGDDLVAVVAVEAPKTPVEHVQVDTPQAKHSGLSIYSEQTDNKNEANSPSKHQTEKKKKRKANDPEDTNNDLISNKLVKPGNVGPKVREDSSNSEAPAPLPVKTEVVEKQTKTNEAIDTRNEMSGATEFSDATLKTSQDTISYTESETQPRSLAIGTHELELSTEVQHRDKNGRSELPDLNLPAAKSPVQATKTTPVRVKSGSPSNRPKGAILEKAIRELEKVVEESRPQNNEVQDSEDPSMAVNRRLPPEVKQTLAKVARLAHSSQGKITEELLGRLMSILGHIVEIKTLKRNLREMIILGLSAKQEKADKFDQILQELIEMIKLHPPSIQCKDMVSPDGKEVKESPRMNRVMEEKVCDLYDTYFQDLDEDKGSQIRKFYVELADLWPEATMDGDGVKTAICRAKARRRAQSNRDKEKARKLLSTPINEVALRGEASSNSQPGATQDKPIVSSSHVLISPVKLESVKQEWLESCVKALVMNKQPLQLDPKGKIV